MYLLSDNSDTWEGMRLAGVDGVILHQREEIEARIKEILQSEEIGIVLITEKLRLLCQAYINNIMLTHKGVQACSGADGISIRGFMPHYIDILIMRN